MEHFTNRKGRTHLVLVLAVMLAPVRLGADADLSPAVQADLYLVQAEDYLSQQNYDAAQEAMDKIVALAEQHDLPLPDQFHFHYGQILHKAGKLSEATASLRRYLELAGRSGEFYRKALQLMSQALQGQDEAAAVAAREAEIDARIAELTEWYRDDEDGTTLLHHAASDESLEVVEALIARDFDVSAPNKWGQTPLHLAGERYPYEPGVIPEVVSVLVSSGADVSAIDNNGCTPLVEIARERIANHPNDQRVPFKRDLAASAEILLDHGAAVDGAGDRCNTPLMMAMLYNGNYEMVNLLVGKGADVNAKRGADSVMDLAISKAGRESDYDQRILQLLSSHRAEPAWACGNERGPAKWPALCREFVSWR